MVFLDNQKVIDLGGIHDLMCRTVKFNRLDGELYISPLDCQCIFEISEDFLREDPLGSKCKSSLPSLLSERRIINIMQKASHTLSIFSAQRTLGESVFGVATNFKIFSHSVNCNELSQTIICGPGHYVSNGACVSCRELHESCKRCGPQYSLTKDSTPECYAYCPEDTFPDEKEVANRSCVLPIWISCSYRRGI